MMPRIKFISIEVLRDSELNLRYFDKNRQLLWQEIATDETLKQLNTLVFIKNSQLKKKWLSTKERELEL